MVVKAERLAVAHPPDMGVASLQLAASLGLATKVADHNDVVARVDEGIGLGLELIEVLRDRREDIVGDALGAAKRALGSASAARLVPLDSWIESFQNCRNVRAVERLVGVAHGVDVLLGHRSSFALAGLRPTLERPWIESKWLTRRPRGISGAGECHGSRWGREGRKRVRDGSHTPPRRARDAAPDVTDLCRFREPSAELRLLSPAVRVAQPRSQERSGPAAVKIEPREGRAKPVAKRSP